MPFWKGPWVRILPKAMLGANVHSSHETLEITCTLGGVHRIMIKVYTFSSSTFRGIGGGSVRAFEQDLQLSAIYALGGP